MIRYDDGAAYDRSMGAWSLLAGAVFLDWLASPPGLRWVDVGCGTGAFTELLMRRCAPAQVHGIDPSEPQLAFARSRPGAAGAVFQRGDAMALPFPAGSFDAAAMALAIFFVPDPPRGVAEMARVVRAGGLVATYGWDFSGGGFPYAIVQAELRELGLNPPLPPSVGAERRDSLNRLWSEAGLEYLDTTQIRVERHFPDFDDFWASTSVAAPLQAMLGALSAADLARVKRRVQAALPTDAAGRVTQTAWANAIKGRVPADA